MEYMIKLTKCQLCNFSQFYKLHTIRKKKVKFTIVRCKNCGLVFQNPRPSDNDVKDMYDEDYFNGRGFDEGVNYIEGMKASSAWEAIYTDRLSNIGRFTKKGYILEVGCGLGDFLHYAKRIGWSVQGVEISEYSSKYAIKNFHIKVFTGTLEQARFKKNSYDAVTMIEVIEHLTDPLTTLRECCRIMSPGGVIVIQTGNVEGLYAKIKGKRWPYYLSGHMTYFSKKTITEMLAKAGLTVTKIYNGDEISFGQFSKMFWHDRGKKKFINCAGFFKASIIYFIRKFGVGGITVYANKNKV